MPDEAAVLAVKPPPAPSEEDYRAFNAALASSARGRAFLAEYARRNRNSDTEILLAGLARLEARIAAEGAAVTRLRDELRMLLIAIRLTRPDIAATSGPAKAIKLAALLDQLERRIETMAEAERAEAQTPTPAVASPNGPLAVVPTPEQPELPIPSPASGQPPAISIVKRTTSVPELTWFDGTPPKPPVAEQPAPAPVAAAPAPAPVEQPAAVAPPAAIVTPAAPTPIAVVTPPAPAAAQIPFAATALAAVVEAAMPTVKIIKAGAIPPPAHFTGEDFSPAPEPAPPAPAAEAAAPPVEIATPVAEIAPPVEIVAPAAEIAPPPVELAAPPAEIVQPMPAAPASLPPVDPLAILMLLSEEERLALFS